eukprot:GILI01010826.1.p1 GENE.GILI01010826.1~~GILI01010826.1.p1  ORF type:complete len:391 (-),score=12.40 GILI01010826.1:28-1137(-)
MLDKYYKRPVIVIKPAGSSDKTSPSPSPSTKLIQSDPIAIHGLPSECNLRFMEGYVSSLNYERRIPHWVLERLVYTKPASKKDVSAKTSDDEDEKAVSREGVNFYTDPDIPPLFQSTNSDYSSMGYSRGHLAAAQFHKNGTQSEMNGTFNLSTNVVPQDMTMNACDWFRLESMTKKLSKDFPNGLFVVTGPLFVPTYDTSTGKKMISYILGGKNDVAVPTHMFKVLMGVKEDNSKAVAAFVMPNRPILEERPLTDFQVPFKYVEQLSGLTLFPKVLHPELKSSTHANTLGASSLKWIGSEPVPYDMCKKHKCEGSYASFSKGFRLMGTIRAASTRKEAEDALQAIVAQGIPIDSRMKKEFDKKLVELQK